MITKRHIIRLIIAGFALSVIATAYENCGNVNFSNGISNTATSSAINQFQPALAVRDTTCIVCHATIQANMITDFGYGSPWYMNGGVLNANDTQFGSTHYDPVSLQSLHQLAGQIIVPDLTVDPSTVAPLIASGTAAPTSPIPLTQFLTMSNIIDISPNWTYGHWGEPVLPNNALTYHVNAPNRAPAAVSEPNIYIGAPTQAQILALVNNLSPAPWVEAVGGAVPTGLSSVAGVNGHNYITNTGPVQCSGRDVVVNGTLLLTNAQIYAELGGCRLYVTGPIFVVGPISYLSTGSTVDPNQNLQMTSSAAIIMGVGINDTADIASATATPLQNRLLVDVRENMMTRSAPSATAYTALGNYLMGEAQNIGSASLPDATLIAPSQTSAPSGSGIATAKIDFTHILLNAPTIQSRYLGTVTGIIVAESMMFSLGQFSFQYDPVFQNVSIFPALTTDILCVGQADISCRPTQL